MDSMTSPFKQSEVSLSLDRAAVHTYDTTLNPATTNITNAEEGQHRLGGHSKNGSHSDDEPASDLSSSITSPKSRLRSIRKKVKSKTKQALAATTSPSTIERLSGNREAGNDDQKDSSDNGSDSSTATDTEPSVLKIKETPLPILAPAPSSTDTVARLNLPAPKRKPPDFKTVVKNPISSIRSSLHGDLGAQVAERVDQQVVTHSADVGLVKAHEELEAAERSNDIGDQDAQENETGLEGIDDGGIAIEVKAAREKVRDLVKERQDQYTRWTIDRHVLRVSQRPPGGRRLHAPRKEDHIKGGKMNWEEFGRELVRYYADCYLDHRITESADIPPASKEAIVTSLERVMVTSKSYQTLAMNIRHIYCWDDMHKTAVYCAAYFTLVLLGQLCAGFLFWMIYLVARRRFNPPTIASLKADIARSEDTEATALNITQLIEQHGAHGWLEAMVEKTGPKMMMQLQDMADAMEVIRSFYEWRDPVRTGRILGIFVALLAAVMICPIEILIRSAQLGAGIMFFGIFPIASHAPQYRHLLSPFRWLFWGLATDAEWAIGRLRAEARHVTSINQPGSTSQHVSPIDALNKNDAKLDQSTIRFIANPHCTTKHPPDRLRHGHLFLTTNECAFVTTVSKTTLWKFEWLNVVAISKIGRGDDGLEFVVAIYNDTEGKEGESEEKEEKLFWVESLRKRDEVFSQILGYCGGEWRVDA